MLKEGVKRDDQDHSLALSLAHCVQNTVKSPQALGMFLYYPNNTIGSGWQKTRMGTNGQGDIGWVKDNTGRSSNIILSVLNVFGFPKHITPYQWKGLLFTYFYILYYVYSVQGQSWFYE